METRLHFEIQPQPNPVTCGPTCLHAVYRYYGESFPLEKVVEETHMLEEGGTLAVLLANHALAKGYRARIYTFNLEVFDPSWFRGEGEGLPEKLRLQAASKKGNRRLQAATPAYLEFLERGGKFLFEDLTPKLIRRFLKQSKPILTGLSSTYLYREKREMSDARADDVNGTPQGHFVVLCGYNKAERTVLVADPLSPNPLAPEPVYELPIERVITSILLGILTYDANLLIIDPPGHGPTGKNDGHPLCRR